jgi:predicted nucleic acid-binding protein
MRSWNLPLLFPDEHISISAGYIKASYGLGLADSYIAAFSLDKNLTLVTKDTDYDALKSEIKIIYLHK